MIAGSRQWMNTEHLDSRDCWCEPQIILVEEEEALDMPPPAIVVHHPWEWQQFMAFRQDGWPLCPRCGEDELWTPWNPPLEADVTLDDYVGRQLRCYACQWISG